MQKVVHRLRLDLERPGIQAVSYMRKGDTLSRRMVLSLYEQGKPYRIEDGVTARIRGKKSDGTILYNDCFVQDNCIVVDVTTQMLAALGEVECELNLYGTSNALLTTPRFAIVVEDVLLADGQLESQNEFTAMTKATEEMKTLYETVDEAYKSGAFKGEKGDKGDDGAPGKDGADGKDGAQGKDGSPGADGVSPTLSISDIPSGHRITITDADGTKSFDVMNGDAESDKLWKPTVSADGTIAWTKTTEDDTPTPQNIKGAQGEPGTPGSPGADGVSPSVAITQITGGHHVAVTDADGTKGFDVLDGEKGADGAPGSPGSPGAAGSPGADGTTFTPAVSEDGDLSWTNDGGKPNPATVNIKGPKGDKGEKGDGSDVFPVGSIYMSTVATSPAALYGGTWERIKDAFLLAAGDTYSAGATGGEATHTLTAAEIPDHKHNGTILTSGSINGTGGAVGRGDWASSLTFSYNSQYPLINFNGGNMGSGAHNNMPPYLSVYVWKRTA